MNYRKCSYCNVHQCPPYVRACKGALEMEWNVLSTAVSPLAKSPWASPGGTGAAKPFTTLSFFYIANLAWNILGSIIHIDKLSWVFWPWLSWPRTCFLPEFVLIRLKYLLNSFCKGLFKGSALLLWYSGPLPFIESVIQESALWFLFTFWLSYEKWKEEKTPKLPQCPLGSMSC